MAYISKIENDLTIKIPEAIIKKAGLKLGDNIIWYYDEVNKQIILSEKPKDFAKELRGLGKDIWGNIDPIDYIKKERQSW